MQPEPEENFLIPAPKSVSLQILAPVFTGEPACFVDFTEPKSGPEQISISWLSGTCSAMFPRTNLSKPPIICFHSDSAEVLTIANFAKLVFTFVLKQWRIVIFTRGEAFEVNLPWKFVSLVLFCHPNAITPALGARVFADSFVYGIGDHSEIDPATGLPKEACPPVKDKEVCLYVSRGSYTGQKLALKSSFKFGYKVISPLQ